MKVVVVNTLYPPYVIGGAEKSVNLLCEAMVRAGVEVVVVSLHPDTATLVERVNGVKVYRLPLDNLYWAFDHKRYSWLLRLRWHFNDIWNRRARRRFSKILEAERPDVVHTNNLTGFSVSIWAESRSKGVPVVHTLRDYSLMCRRATLFRSGKNCESRCLDCSSMTLPSRIMSHRVGQVIGNSRFLLDRHKLAGYFEGVEGEVIYNIMDKIATPDLPAPARSTCLTFGYIGKIDQDKGIEIILAATTRLKNAAWELKIAGRGSEEYVAELKSRFSDHRIEWLGFTSVDDFFGLIDVTIVSSIWFEPLPRVLIESIAHRRAAICSTAGGTPEIARYANLIGEYEATDVDALVVLMDGAISERSFAELSAADSQIDLAHLFSPSVVASRNISVYEAALEIPTQ